MSALGQISIKTKDGMYKNYTISINDDTNEYGQNLKMYEEQTKEDREAGVKKNYVGNGKIFWTDGKISVADKVDRETTKTSSDVDLPF
tara:strand:+ start:786 stop:1049 length:264 start_codon:yes stop_codon:yes gene_type:complete